MYDNKGVNNEGVLHSNCSIKSLDSGGSEVGLAQDRPKKRLFHPFNCRHSYNYQWFH